MASVGWIKLWRKAADNPHLKEHDVRGVFDLLLLRAVREDGDAFCAKIKKWVRLKRGQLWLSPRSLVTNRVSHKRIRTILDLLVAGELIHVTTTSGADTKEGTTLGTKVDSTMGTVKGTTESAAEGTTKGTTRAKTITVVTICNYDRYQIYEAENSENGAQRRAQRKNGRGHNPGHEDGTERGTTKGTQIKEEEKEDKEGLGYAHARGAKHHGHDPPTTKPDPDRFLMTMDWMMERDVENRLEQKFVPELGSAPFWRQIERFMKHHCELGTVDTQWGFSRSLEKWLARANANRERAVA